MPNVTVTPRPDRATRVVSMDISELEIQHAGRYVWERVLDHLASSLAASFTTEQKMMLVKLLEHPQLEDLLDNTEDLLDLLEGEDDE